MAHETTAGHHPHKDDGAVHAHISSTPFYVTVFLALIALTVLTVGQSYVDLGRLNLIVVILIAFSIFTGYGWTPREYVIHA